MKQMYYMRRCRWSSDRDKDDINLVNTVNYNMVASPKRIIGKVVRFHDKYL